MALKLLGRTGAVAGRDVPVSDLLRIGASADSDLRLVLGGISRNHARIVKTEGAYWLEDAGSTNGTFLNGQRVARERLRHLDIVTLGRDVDLIVATSDRVDTAMAAKTVSDAWLSPLDGAGSERVDLPVGELTIGRLAPSNVILESLVISHLHARIQRTADQVIVQDLGSVNGTFVNGQRIATATLLKDGDALSIAGIRNFRVHVAGDGGRVRPQEVVAPTTGVFDQEWKTKLVWSADELAGLEEERQKILASAQQVQPQAAVPKPPAPAAVAAVVPPKPVAAAVAAVLSPKLPAPPAAARPQELVPTIVTPAVRPALTGIKLSGPLGAFTLAKGRHSVGRLETASVPILDLQVSRNHAVIMVGGDGASVEDAASANGTFLNGERVQDKPVTLKQGDRLAFGSVEFKVELMS